MEAAEQEFQRLRPLKPLWDQDQQTSEHVAQRSFTRQRELERHELDLRPGSLDCSRLGFGFSSFKPASFMTSAASTPWLAKTAAILRVKSIGRYGFL
jgi:hypothetical protein